MKEKLLQNLEKNDETRFKIIVFFQEIPPKVDKKDSNGRKIKFNISRNQNLWKWLKLLRNYHNNNQNYLILK